MSDILNDPMFFYSVALVIFLALVYRYGKTPILGWIDNEIQKIRDEVERANQLRAEAEQTFAAYKAMQHTALEEAEAIVRQAKAESENLRRRAENDLKDLLTRHEQQAAERIRIAEAEAVRDVRAAAVDLAMKLARESLAGLDDAAAAQIIDQAIAEMPGAAALKAKAA